MSHKHRKPADQEGQVAAPSWWDEESRANATAVASQPAPPVPSPVRPVAPQASRPKQDTRRGGLIALSLVAAVFVVAWLAANCQPTYAYRCCVQGGSCQLLVPAVAGMQCTCFAPFGLSVAGETCE